MPLFRPSISLRLTAWFGGIFLAGWVLFGAAMWLNLKSTLTEERYLTLTRRADRLQDVLLKSADEEPADRQQDFTDFAHATGGGLAEIFRQNGTRVYSSPSASARVFPWPPIRGQISEVFTHTFASDHQPYWVLTRPFTMDGTPLFLQVAAPEAGNLLVLERFWEGLLASVPVLLLVSSVGGYWLSGRALKPVDRITATARSISIRNLSDRVHVTKTGDELQRLAETCNAMLARLESAVTQIKQFTANASHELRGPLTFVRTVAEVAMRNPCADAGSRRAFEDIIEETANAALLLEDMLTLARADADCGDAVLEPMNLVAVVEEVCEMARPIAAGRSLALYVNLPDDGAVNVFGDSASLRRLLWILLDNALKYTPAPGKVDIDLRSMREQAIVRVSDTGVGIAEKDLAHIFDRFFRADQSRTQIEGSGLGLAIARWIAQMHHANLSVISEVNKGSVFEISFPSAP